MTAEAAAAPRGAKGLSPERVLARAAGENFAVAPRFLPRRLREPLLALYGFARWVDEIGDAAPRDGLPLLDEIEQDLSRAARGEARHPLLRRLAPWLASRRLPLDPFLRLVEANRRDLRGVSIASFEALLAECEWSANPVGELVLHVFEAATPGRVALSNDVCSALQVIEHCQDVREDLLRGRVYLPAADLAAQSCGTELLASPGAPALRRAIGVLIARSRALLASGAPLLAELRGFARLAVAGYVAGGLAACDALERAGYDASAPGARATRGARVWRAARILVARGGA
jgi:squalene synthase HpnC